MSVTVDANILVYASNEADPMYHPARSLLERLSGGPDLVYLFWPTIMGYMRIVTHPAILPRPLTLEQAAGNVSELLGRSHIRTPGEDAGFWELYLKTAHPNARGNNVPDAHIVTLMRQHGVATIYTRDRHLRSYGGITARDPFS
jgi:toxin-antitoxin system PIN domain toxin